MWKPPRLDSGSVYGLTFALSETRLRGTCSYTTGENGLSIFWTFPTWKYLQRDSRTRHFWPTNEIKKGCRGFYNQVRLLILPAESWFFTINWVTTKETCFYFCCTFCRVFRTFPWLENRCWFKTLRFECVYLCWPCWGRSWWSVCTRLEEGNRPEDETNTWTQSHLQQEKRQHIISLSSSVFYFTVRSTAFCLLTWKR